MVALTAWGSILVHVVISTAIAAAATLVGSRAGGRRALPAAFGRLFEVVEERRTFMGLPAIFRTSRTHRWVLVIVVFASAPTLAAIVTSLLGGPVGLGDLVDALALWQDVPVSDALVTYAVILLVHLLVCWWFLRVTRRAVASGDVEQPPLLRQRSSADVRSRLVAGALLDEGGTLEELGWRAFALPLLLLELDRGPATLVLALIWWAWHLPREVPGLLRSGLTRRWSGNQALFIGTCISLSVLCTEVVMRTGSVWPAILVHGGTNVWSKALGAAPNQRWGIDVRTVIVGAMAVLVAASWVIS